MYVFANTKYTIPKPTVSYLVILSMGKPNKTRTCQTVRRAFSLTSHYIFKLDLYDSRKSVCGKAARRCLSENNDLTSFSAYANHSTILRKTNKPCEKCSCPSAKWMSVPRGQIHYNQPPLLFISIVFPSTFYFICQTDRRVPIFRLVTSLKTPQR